MLVTYSRPCAAPERACRVAPWPHVAAVRALRNARHCQVAAGAATHHEGTARREIPPEIAAIRQDVPVKGKAKRAVALHVGYVGSNYRGVTQPPLTAAPPQHSHHTRLRIYPASKKPARHGAAVASL